MKPGPLVISTTYNWLSRRKSDENQNSNFRTWYENCGFGLEFLDDHSVRHLVLQFHVPDAEGMYGGVYPDLVSAAGGHLGAVRLVPPALVAGLVDLAHDLGRLVLTHLHVLRQAREAKRLLCGRRK